MEKPSSLELTTPAIEEILAKFAKEVSVLRDRGAAILKVQLDTLKSLAAALKDLHYKKTDEPTPEALGELIITTEETIKSFFNSLKTELQGKAEEIAEKLYVLEIKARLDAFPDAKELYSTRRIPYETFINISIDQFVNMGVPLEGLAPLKDLKDFDALPIDQKILLILQKYFTELVLRAIETKIDKVKIEYFQTPVETTPALYGGERNQYLDPRLDIEILAEEKKVNIRVATGNNTVEDQPKTMMPVILPPLPGGLYPPRTRGTNLVQRAYDLYVPGRR